MNLVTILKFPNKQKTCCFRTDAIFISITTRKSSRWFFSSFLFDGARAWEKKILNVLISKGGTTVGELEETEILNVGFLSFIYARDIDGNIIELQSWK